MYVRMHVNKYLHVCMSKCKGGCTCSLHVQLQVYEAEWEKLFKRRRLLYFALITEMRYKLILITPCSYRPSLYNFLLMHAI